MFRITMQITSVVMLFLVSTSNSFAQSFFKIKNATEERIVVFVDQSGNVLTTEITEAKKFCTYIFSYQSGIIGRTDLNCRVKISNNRNGKLSLTVPKVKYGFGAKTTREELELMEAPKVNYVGVIQAAIQRSINTNQIFNSYTFLRDSSMTTGQTGLPKAIVVPVLMAAEKKIEQAIKDKSNDQNYKIMLTGTEVKAIINGQSTTVLMVITGEIDE